MNDSASMRNLTCGQWLATAGLTAGLVAGIKLDPQTLWSILVVVAATTFLSFSLWRLLLIVVSAKPLVNPGEPLTWPRYTILAALYDEAEVVSQLIDRLSRIDYPADRLQGMLVMEADDHATINAAREAQRPDWLEIYIAPPGTPRTKPRALNCALPYATGDLLVVYDAEDDPDPLQLKEGAGRFAEDMTGRLACLQAPLRIRRRYKAKMASPFLDRQFAGEYAALFETTLPRMARLRLPFPLGGTSNHFRVDVLRRIGGWDSFNVTEDADLGFRLWRRGWRLGVISRPTWETPPGGMQAWLPQRTRWLKGYMQTWLTHTRRPQELGFRGAFALCVTLGIGLASAALQGPSMSWLTTTIAVSLAAGMPPHVPLLAWWVLSVGTACAWLSCVVGARRAGVSYTAKDMLAAPFYWSLLSLAFVHAVWRLIVKPYAWDKTAHEPDLPTLIEHDPVAESSGLDEALPVSLSASHVAAPEPVT